MDRSRTTSELRVDLHTHTRYSPDATMPPRELVERAVDAGLDRIAVTDHGTLDGAFEAKEAAPDRVIIGEEIRCACQTELIGLFLREEVPEGLRLEEVVERIRGQGGLVYAPHPYAYPWRPMWRAGRALAVADIVEAINARAFLPFWNRAALGSARRRALPLGAGSDAHFPPEVGRAYTEMAPFGDAREFLRAAAGGRPVGVATTGPAYHVASSALKAWRLVSQAGRRLGEGWATPQAATIDG